MLLCMGNSYLRPVVTCIQFIIRLRKLFRNFRQSFSLQHNGVGQNGRQVIQLLQCLVSCHSLLSICRIWHGGGADVLFHSSPARDQHFNPMDVFLGW